MKSINQNWVKNHSLLSALIIFSSSIKGRKMAQFYLPSKSTGQPLFLPLVFPWRTITVHSLPYTFRWYNHSFFLSSHFVKTTKQIETCTPPLRCQFEKKRFKCPCFQTTALSSGEFKQLATFLLRLSQITILKLNSLTFFDLIKLNSLLSSASDVYMFNSRRFMVHPLLLCMYVMRMIW